MYPLRASAFLFALLLFTSAGGTARAVASTARFALFFAHEMQYEGQNDDADGYDCHGDGYDRTRDGQKIEKHDRFLPAANGGRLGLFFERLRLLFAAEIDFALIAEYKVRHDQRDNRRDDERSPPPGEHEVERRRGQIRSQQPECERPAEFALGKLRPDPVSYTHLTLPTNSRV